MTAIKNIEKLQQRKNRDSLILKQVLAFIKALRRLQK